MDVLEFEEHLHSIKSGPIIKREIEEKCSTVEEDYTLKDYQQIKLEDIVKIEDEEYSPDEDEAIFNFDEVANYPLDEPSRSLVDPLENSSESYNYPTSTDLFKNYQTILISTEENQAKKAEIGSSSSGLLCFYCYHCSYKACHKEKLKSHLKMEHLESSRLKSSQLQPNPKNFLVQDRQADDKPFSCPHCEYSFTRSNHLKVHIQAKHLGERPFSCPHYSLQDQPAKKSYMYCFVPGCTSTTISCPEKIFFSLPYKEPVRGKWMKMVRRDLTKQKFSPKTHLHCCEDHFDVEADMVNYRKYKWYKENGFRVKASLKPGALPHKFECQPSRLLTKPVARHSVIDKLKRQATLTEAIRAAQSGLPGDKILTQEEEEVCPVLLKREDICSVSPTQGLCSVSHEFKFIDKDVQTIQCKKQSYLSKFVLASPIVSSGESFERGLSDCSTQKKEERRHQ